ncbi:hypothetical protein TWF694_007216 [Orbilia ellipsospora]|uniref:Uncharacterized protein n=1 Tax=Orbilia ellipsospora TaxID=2528407 RepID=A0AAV9XH25_9PEZI
MHVIPLVAAAAILPSMISLPIPRKGWLTLSKRLNLAGVETTGPLTVVIDEPPLNGLSGAQATTNLTASDEQPASTPEQLGGIANPVIVVTAPVIDANPAIIEAETV